MFFFFTESDSEVKCEEQPLIAVPIKKEKKKKGKTPLEQFKIRCEEVSICFI